MNNIRGKRLPAHPKNRAHAVTVKTETQHGPHKAKKKIPAIL